MQGYVIRTVSTFDDSMLRRRDANNEMEDPEDQISPRGALEFPGVEASNTQRKNNTSMASKSSISSSRSLKRVMSDSHLLSQTNKSMHTWKCNLCFHDNLNTMLSACAMCGTDMDASFMAALNALDNLKDPSVHNDEDNVESSEEESDQSADRDQDRLCQTTFTDRDVSFRTADEDTTFVSFQTAQQSVNMRTDVSTINPGTVGTSMVGDGSMEDENEMEQEKENYSNESSSNKSDSSDKVQLNISVRDTVLKMSQSLMDMSLNSSITMQNQISMLQNASMLDTTNEMQANDAVASKTTIDNTDDSIHTLLNVTYREEDEEFDPMLFQSDDVVEAEILCDRQDEGESQKVEYAFETSETPAVENISGRPFAFEKEIQLDEYIQELHRKATTEQSFDVFPYVTKAENESMKVCKSKSRVQIQVQVPMGDQENIVEERESFVNQNVWRIRKTVAVTVTAIVLVSIFALA